MEDDDMQREIDHQLSMDADCCCVWDETVTETCGCTRQECMGMFSPALFFHIAFWGQIGLPVANAFVLLSMRIPPWALWTSIAALIVVGGLGLLQFFMVSGLGARHNLLSLKIDAIVSTVVLLALMGYEFALAKYMPRFKPGLIVLGALYFVVLNIHLLVVLSYHSKEATRRVEAVRANYARRAAVCDRENQ